MEVPLLCRISEMMSFGSASGIMLGCAIGKIPNCVKCKGCPNYSDWTEEWKAFENQMPQQEGEQVMIGKVKILAESGKHVRILLNDNEVPCVRSADLSLCLGERPTLTLEFVPTELDIFIDDALIERAEPAEEKVYVSMTKREFIKHWAKDQPPRSEG